MLFASAGYQVTIYDTSPSELQNALKFIEEQLNYFESKEVLRGKLTAAEQFSCIRGCTELKEVIDGALFVQECVRDNLDAKRALYSELDKIVDDKVILSSSVSYCLPSTLSENLKHRSQVLASHPMLPVYHCPLVEIVPSPWTRLECVEMTRKLMEEIERKPAVLTREIEGFILNRIQNGILNECYNLVTDGIASVKDIELVMSEGLGMRYAFDGPLETAHLMADGFENYCERLGQKMYEVSKTFKPPPKMEGPALKEIGRQLFEMCPREKLPEKRARRDECLMELNKLKQKMN